MMQIATLCTLLLILNCLAFKGTLIEEYKFKLMYDQNSAKLGYIDINYDIVPIYEIRNIRNKIRVVDSISS